MSDTEKSLLADYPDHRVIGRLPGTEYLVFEYLGDMFSIQGSVVCRMDGQWLPVNEKLKDVSWRKEGDAESLPKGLSPNKKQDCCGFFDIQPCRESNEPKEIFAGSVVMDASGDTFVMHADGSKTPVSLSFGPMTRHTLNLSTGLCTTIAGVDQSVVESAVKNGAFSQCSRCSGIGANPGARVCQHCDGWGVVRGGDDGRHRNRAG